jgi:hypothetical protein
LCDVHETAGGSNQPLVIKIPRVAGCDHLLEKEQAVLRHLHSQHDSDFYGKYFPQPVRLVRSRGRLMSTLRFRRGLLTAEQIRRRYPAGLDGRHLAWMFNRLLEALGFVHRHGWVHGAPLPPHLLFQTESHALQLIGWIHCEPIDTPLRIVAKDFKSWYPPECHRREAATPATDIALAAKSILWLAGGDPHRGQVPSHVPTSLAEFWRDCLAGSVCNFALAAETSGAKTGPVAASLVGERSNLAWQLHEQFRELLEDLYGPPEFCHLNMS